MLRSAAARLEPRRPLDVYVVDGGLEPADRGRVVDSLAGRASVHWISPERDAFAGLPLWGRMPVTTYDKIMVAELLPPSLAKALWLDCDVLVQADLTALWDLPFLDRLALAVQDDLVPTLGARFGVAGRVDLALPADAPYFNAGVMAIDLARWRGEEVARRAIEYLKRYRDRVFFWDQEALNAVLAGRWGALDGAWNRSVSPNGRRLSRREPDPAPARILHFTGNLKPWRYPSASPFHELWFRTLDETVWAGWRPERSWRGALLGRYGSSRARRALYPAERWAMQILRRATRRTVRPDPGS